MVSNVPASSVYVIAVSNLPTEVESRFPSSPENANITSVQNLALNVNQLSDGTGGVAAIPLYGIGNITNSSEEMGYWETHVDLRPVGSRLEIKQFTAENDIKEYQVDGIFISSFYQFMSISGTPSSLIHKGEENDNHTKYKGGSAEYPDELPLWDYNSSGLGVFNNTTLEYASANIGNVWAYNLFPGVGTNTTNKDVPHIIIRLSNIQYADGTTATGPKYLTVKGYNGNKLFFFVKGNVYSISNLQFNSTNLTDKLTVPDPGTDPGINPGTDPKEVDVDITVISWIVQSVIADL
ncbi:MAG: hypothetical protein LUD02_11435 [Tannerellaceae bacterium]|nr:hypothetical protein [Tannerellaceae bacterium]MCD8264670.1 hypothetical protein [Tannerellaceae bacterium]